MLNIEFFFIALLINFLKEFEGIIYHDNDLLATFFFERNEIKIATQIFYKKEECRVGRDYAKIMVNNLAFFKNYLNKSGKK